MFYIDYENNISSICKKDFSTSQQMFIHLWKQQYNVNLNYTSQNLKKSSDIHFCLYKKNYNPNV